MQPLQKPPQIHVDIPPLYCPFPAAKHPQASRLTEAGMDFMTRFGFCATQADRTAVENIDAGNFTAYWFPDPELPFERLQVIADFLFSAFRMDDLRCEKLGAVPDSNVITEMVIKYFHVWGTPKAFVRDELDIFSQTAHDLATRSRQLATPTQAARLTYGLGRWILGLLRAGALRSLGRFPGVDEFIPLKVASGAGTFMVDVVAFVCPQEVPCSEWDSDEVQAILKAAVTVEQLDNDLFSHAKESWLSTKNQDSSQSLENLVSFMEHQYGCSTAEAFERVADYRNRIMCLYTRLRKQISAHASPALAAHLNAVDAVIAGNLHYHATGTRYHNPDGHHPHAITFTTSITDVCPVVDYTPPVRSLAWWWDQLYT